ncbi:MAG TPA: Coq4 family protein [Burkholderiales bacterium]|nr:Coq4 family protein [Burkholderiales bacterium]
MAQIRIPDNHYFATNNVAVETDSSVLVSSSKYLNNVLMRDWVATYLLRRNGRDRTVSSDNIDLNKALAEVLDADEIDALFEEERKHNPGLDRWLAERFISTYEIDDFKQYAPDTVGGLYYNYLVSRNFRVDIHAAYEPTGHYDFFRRRSTQIHDFEHIICGGSFDEIGELVPYFMRLYNVPKFISPRLAGELSVKSIFGALRMVTRSILHYPETWLSVMNAMQRGMKVGELSGPIFLFRYEEVFHLRPAEARKVLGVVGAEDVDTHEASLIFTEQKRPEEPRSVRAA